MKMNNKNAKDLLHDIIAGAMILMSFWGILYPEFALGADAYIKTENGKPVQAVSSVEDFKSLLEAKPGEVEVELGFLEGLKELWSGGKKD